MTPRRTLAAALRRVADRLDPPLPPARSTVPSDVRSVHPRWAHALARGKADAVREIILPALIDRGWSLAQLAYQIDTNQQLLSLALTRVAHLGRRATDQELARVCAAADVLGLGADLRRVLDAPNTPTTP